MELTVLGCSGSYGAPAGGACSGYLVRAGRTAIWLDCGNGTLPALAHHVPIDAIDAVVVSHGHPDHWLDLCGLHVAYKYGYGRQVPVLSAPGVDEPLRSLVGDWSGQFTWTTIDDRSVHEVGDLTLRFARTDHPVPTFAVEIAGDDKRLVYTADTGPGWSPTVFDPADLLVIEASYQDAHGGHPVHLTARQAGTLARDAGARRTMITHVWPQLDPAVSVAEATAAYGREVMLAAPHATVTV